MVVLLGPVVALVYADTWVNAGRDGPLLRGDDVLMQISPFAALIEATQHYRADRSCETAEFLSTVVLTGDESEDGEFVARFVAEIRDECEVLNLAVAETAAVFESIKRTKVLPDSAYVFGLFVFDPNLEGALAGFAEETIGLFDNREACERVESVARERELPTRRCSVWDNRDLL